MRTSFVCRRVFILPLFSALLLIVAGCASERPTVSGLPATLPLDTLNGHMTVEGEINGQRMTFVIDTGFTWSSISAEAARRAGLAPDSAKVRRSTDISNALSSSRVVRVPELFLLTRQAESENPAGPPADAAPEQVVFHDAEFDLLGPPAFQYGYDGVIGLDLLRMAVIRFDVPGKRLDLRLGELEAEGSIPLSAKRGGPSRTFVHTRWRLLRIARHGQLSIPSASPRRRANGSASQVRHRRLTMSAELRRGFELFAARLAGDVAIGPLRLVRPVVAILPDQGFDANFGVASLMRISWELDVRRRRVRFATVPPPEYWAWWEMPGYSFSGRNKRVDWVLSGGNAAAAGMQLGDEIVSINGVSATTLYQPLMPSGSYPVVIRRDGGERTIKLKMDRCFAEPSTSRPADATTAPSP